MTPTMLFLGLGGEVRDRWRSALEPRGWTIQEAHDVKSALDLANNARPSVVVSATEPEDAAGFHFVRALRAIVEHDVKIIGLARPDALVRAAKAGFDFLIDESDESVDFDKLHASIAGRRPDEEIRATTKMPRLR